VEKDSKEALKWYMRAAAQGHEDAKKRLDALKN
jgi:TPR repeat protein